MKMSVWVEPNIVPYSNVILFLKEQTDLLNKFPPDKKQLYLRGDMYHGRQNCNTELYK